MSTVDPSYEPRNGSRDLTHRDADWSSLRVVVAGLGISGFSLHPQLALFSHAPLYERHEEVYTPPIR